MLAYVIRRLLQTVVVIFGVTLLTFGIVFATGDPTLLLVGSASPPEMRMWTEWLASVIPGPTTAFS